MTLTGYLLATAGEDSRRIVEVAEIMRMSREDQIRFAEALIEPPKPNKRLAMPAPQNVTPLSSRRGDGTLCD